MKTIHEMMKHIYTAGLIVASLVLPAGMASCASDTMEETGSLYPASTHANDSDEVIKMLKTVPGVTEITKQKSSKEEYVCYYFKFTQNVTHEASSPYKTTFKQRAYLRFVGLDAPVVLHTQGYAMPEVDNVADIDVADYLKANIIELEHRYFGQSLPEPDLSLDFTYFNAEEAAADLHELVSAFKQSMFPKNKWVATGASKNGITSAFYAYFSSKKGWKDMDLFVPFCAPFPANSSKSPSSTHVGDYLIHNCGTGYPEGSVEAIARARVSTLPRVIVDNPTVRKTFINYYKEKFPSILSVLQSNLSSGGAFTTGNLEKDIIAYIMSYYYHYLFQKFSYMTFSSWAPYVPDPEKVATDEFELMNLLAFTFLENANYVNYVKKLKKTQESAGTRTRVAFNDAEIINFLEESNSAPYSIQCMKELGFNKYAFTDLKGCSYITPEDADKLNNVFFSPEKFNGTEPGYHNYVKEWDNGQLMTGFREWVKTQTTTPMIFVYGSNDPWTGGKIDDPATPMVKVIMNMGGYHNSFFLDKNRYTPEATQAIKTAISQYVGL